MDYVTIVMQRDDNRWSDREPGPDRPVRLYYDPQRASVDLGHNEYLIILPVLDTPVPIIARPLSADDFSERIAKDLELSQVIPNEGHYMVINDEEYGYDTDLVSTNASAVGTPYTTDWLPEDR
jgi:hypothetical protein